MDDWVLLGEENLSSDDEEIVISSFTTDPYDLVVALSSSDEKEISSPESDSSSDEQEYLPDDDSLIDSAMGDDVFDLRPVVNPELEKINRIVHLVLPRLPAKSLLRFKLVSPDFNTLISSPFMVLSHFLQPKMISGLFYRSIGTCYVSFDAPLSDLPDPSLSFLPEPVTIKASTRGLMCVRGHETLKYYITNPTTKEWVELPEPTTEHSDDVAVVVVFDEPSVYNFGGDYQIVCAYPVVAGVWGFETFSTEKWAWTRSSEICPVENVVAASGTAVEGVAYWRTTMETLLSYNPMKDSWNIMERPHARAMNEAWWELGEMDGRLTVTSKSSTGQILVSAIEATNKRGEPYYWKVMRSFYLSEAAGHRIATPIRSQGLAALVFWEVKKYERGLVLRNIQGQVIREFQEPECFAEFIPYVSTLVPVKRSGAGTSGISIQDAIQDTARLKEEMSMLAIGM